MSHKYIDWEAWKEDFEGQMFPNGKVAPKHTPVPSGWLGTLHERGNIKVSFMLQASLTNGESYSPMYELDMN